jgi:hypothetical protein
MSMHGVQAATSLLAVALLVSAAGAQEATPAPSPSPAPEASPTPRPDETPGTRAFEWRQLRERRASQIEPYEPGFVERQVLAFEKAERPSFLDFNLLGFYPRFLGIARGSKVAAGVRFWKPDIGGTTFDVHGSAFWSIAGYEYYDVQFGRIPHRGKQFPVRVAQSLEVYQLGDMEPGESGRVILNGSVRYQHYPRVHYFGQGPDTTPETESNFLDQKAFYEVIGGYQFSKRFSLTGRAGYMQAFVGPGEDPDEPSTREVFTDATAPGLDDPQPDFLVLSGQALWDGRDVPGNPRKGAVVGVQVAHVGDRGGQEFGFTRVATDLRGFVPLGSVQRVLALRAYLSSDNPDAGQRVPFYLQSDLGGSHTLRGYDSFRFRDNHVLLLQAEYRWYPAPAVELALFGDAGRVSPDFSGVFGRLRADAGAGIRFKSDVTTYFRLDVAKGDEGWRVSARFSQAF